MKAPPRHSFRVLRDRDFAIFFVAALVSNSGSWMQAIAAPYVLYQLTHSTTWLGVGAFMAFFPALCVGPLAGSLADRFPRKRLLFFTQSGMMLTAFGLWAVWESGAATPELIVALLFLSGIASGLNIAAWQSFVPQLVVPADLLAAVRLNSMQFVAARAFGPALAGVVLQVYGAGTAFFLNGVSFVLVLGALGLIHPRPVVLDGEAGRVLQHFRDAVAYVRARAALFLPVLTIAVLSLLGSSVQQLAPAFADDVFGVGKSGYGFLVSAFGMGAVVGSFVVGFWADRYLRSRVTVVGLFIFTVGEVLFASTHAYAVGLAGMVVMGSAYVLIATALNTSLQARVDEAHRGRAISIYLMGLLAGVPLGALVQGKLAELIGLQATVLAAAAGLLACAIAGIVRFEGFAPLDEAIEVETGRGPDLVLDTPPSIAAAD
ncbi:MAG TPA: MFS transporter [Acidimicrobiia bacterium]